MNWDYESNETSPNLILATLGDLEEMIESPVQLEIDNIVSDAESVIEGSLVSEELTDTGGFEAEPQESIFYGGVQWDASWLEDWDLYDG